ncbi:molybdopterin-dependent oxidoreductase [Oceanobacillus salinisoli]|uniref:molybdopterin-dependent oxidoreductase n=1 Tax=Oceanobacillus salinisoli TaxID=2678611 RepID=UPI002F35DDF0
MSSSEYLFGRPYLMTRSLQPENQESPIHFIKSDLVNDELFYRRNHFSYPSFSNTYYFLPVFGAVHMPRFFSIQEILRMPSRNLKMVLECAGNKRSLFEPETYGEQWEKGAISQGEWKGVPLRNLLQLVGLASEAREVVIEGHDFGKTSDSDEYYTYTRSLPIEKALPLTRLLPMSTIISQSLLNMGILYD